MAYQRFSVPLCSFIFTVAVKFDLFDNRTGTAVRYILFISRADDVDAASQVVFVVVIVDIDKFIVHVCVCEYI